MTRVAVLQMRSGVGPAQNAATIVEAVERAAGEGAAMLFTPEMSGLLDRDRTRAGPKIMHEANDRVLSAVRDAAAREGLWIALGSLAIDLGDGKWANRSYLIDSSGNVATRYDKMHMFDVDLANGESWRESNAYRAGEEIVTAQTPLGRLGLTICYDLRFPALFEALGNRQCDAIAIPAAFTVPTGEAHWHVLQRARAIEASAYVIAAAQVGTHEDGRRTYGHSLVADPWGEVLLDMGGEAPGLGFAEIIAERIAEVRRQVPSLANRRKMPD
ncbi:carbon-nitrogen hydrolase family protein [Pelagerythrobacter rhizovicinus]|uniref:Carbon-nitrogen hydrolase family protein n=1 Tax=Pelagerythrobacter rhizovicinus TaxID=2268576 RepID=A0A4Q2KL77_9SPHN|nr:carbon-nitrogen hydrolase family protein [Pelagerythrobacter rhizovicinus]RXZ66065.1 carbon-nitrogen hydrolase family protein [Pelagerythrobacter rhizovicinus]